MDAMPPWFWVPATLVLWVGWVVLELRATPEDPYDELTGLDVLEKTGSHPHG